MNPIIWLFAAKLYLLHPFHVSVCDVTYNTDDKHLKISVRLFMDDLENGLRIYTNDEKLDIAKLDSAFLYQTMEKYIINNFVLYIKKKQVVLSFLGGEVEDDVMWCYLEIEKLRPFDNMTVTNTLLMAAFRDQENLVHVRRDGVVKSMRMRGDEITQRVAWD